MLNMRYISTKTWCASILLQCFILPCILICSSHAEGTHTHWSLTSGLCLSWPFIAFIAGSHMWVHMGTHEGTLTHWRQEFRTSAYLDRWRPFIAEFVRNLLTPSRLQDGLPSCLPVVRDLPLLVLHGVLHQRLQLNSSSTGHWYRNHFDKDWCVVSAYYHLGRIQHIFHLLSGTIVRLTIDYSSYRPIKGTRQKKERYLMVRVTTRPRVDKIDYIFVWPS